MTQMVSHMTYIWEILVPSVVVLPSQVSTIVSAHSSGFLLDPVFSPCTLQPMMNQSTTSFFLDALQQSQSVSVVGLQPSI